MLKYEDLPNDTATLKYLAMEYAAEADRLRDEVHQRIAECLARGSFAWADLASSGSIGLITYTMKNN